jgi:hypothetical protein
MSSFIELIKGYFDSNELLLWIIVQASLYALFLYIAYRYHIKSNPYSIMKHTMSFLGSHLERRNPKGWFFFSIGMIIMGIMFFPLILYYHHRMLIISEWAAWLGTILQILGTIGIILVALFPDNEEEESFYKDLQSGKLHNVFAGILFVGLGIGNLWFGGMFVYDALWGDHIFNSVRLIPPYVFFVIILAIGGFLQLKWAKICKKDTTKVIFPGEGLYSFPLLEWTLILYVFGMVYYILLTLPNVLS